MMKVYLMGDTKMSKPKEDDFVVRYTNKDIMDKLDTIDSKLDATKGLAKKAMWAAGTGITLATLSITLIMTHVVKV